MPQQLILKTSFTDYFEEIRVTSTASTKTIVVLIIVTVIGGALFVTAPPDIEPGQYTAVLDIKSPGIVVHHALIVTFVESGPANSTKMQFIGSSTNITLVASSVIVIGTNSPLVFELSIEGDRVDAKDIVLALFNQHGFNETLRPTHQAGQKIIIEYQPLVHSSAALMILGVIAILWFTEGISLVATSILIPVLIVVTGIQGARTVLAAFFDPAVALIFGGFMLGRALSKYELDKRFALLILHKSASSGSRLLLTVMASTAFLSMWISNTASAAIMIPIALAMIANIRHDEIRDSYSKALVLGVAYSATLGGVGSLVGSPPNPLAASYISSFLGVDFSFMNWLPFGLPVLLIMLPLIWRWLLYRFKVPTDVEEIQELRKVSEQEYLRLGPMTRDQKMVVVIFVSVIVLWFTQRLPDVIANVIGWSGHGISSAIVALMGAVALMVLRLLDEHDVSSRIGWSSLLILGSGIALGGAMIETGLSTYLAHRMIGLGVLPSFLVVIIIGSVAILLTMVASNTGAAVILIPIAIPLANGLGIDPMLVVMVIAIAVTMDFALPTGTPPSTIAYSTGKVSLREMVSTGLMIDFIAMLVVTIVAVWLWSLLGLVVL